MFWSLHSERSGEENIALKAVQPHMFSRKKANLIYHLCEKSPDMVFDDPS